MSEQTIEPLVVLGLGANLGNPLETLAGVLKEIGKLPQTELVAVNPFYKTAPVDSSGPDYVNAVCAVKTALAPQELLDELQRLENLHGRVRPAGVRNAPRTLDLDVLLWGSQTICTSRLVVPHPRMHERAFVLRPLTDILPECVIPGKGRAADWLEGTLGQRISKIST